MRGRRRGGKWLPALGHWGSSVSSSRYRITAFVCHHPVHRIPALLPPWQVAARRASEAEAELGRARGEALAHRQEAQRLQVRVPVLHPCS